MWFTENINGLKLVSIVYWKEGRKVGTELAQFGTDI